MEFNDATEFANYLRGKPEIVEILPWSNDLMHYCDVINQGCNCGINARTDRAEGVYVGLLKDILDANKDIQHFIKKFSGESSFTFKSKGEVILTF
tara:strand:- start:144 stop:428 length:285 start_codon:yes stop_codon:yes gene_type:complete